MIGKKKAPTIDLPLPKLSGKHRELYDILTGKRRGEGFHNAAGLLLDNNNALLTTSHDRIFIVALAVGNKLYRVGEIHKANPAIRAISDQLTVFGPTPAEIERREKRKEFERMDHNERVHKIVDDFQKVGIDARVVKQAGQGIKIRRGGKKNAPDLAIV